jgi:hypothetical protein
VIWSKIRELAELSGHSLTPPPVISAEEKRALEFNRIYREFLENMCVAFPHDESLLDDFAAAESVRPAHLLCLEDFRRIVMPRFQEFLHNPGSILANPGLLRSLPFVCNLPLEEYWQCSVIENDDNSGLIVNYFTSLLTAASGLNNLNSNLVGMLQGMLMSQIDEQPNLEFPQFLAMGNKVLQTLQQNGNFQSLVQDLRGNIGNLDGEMLQQMAAAALPEQFRGLETNLTQGLVRGSTGTPAFGTLFAKPSHAPRNDAK